MNLRISSFRLIEIGKPCSTIVKDLKERISMLSDAFLFNRYYRIILCRTACTGADSDVYLFPAPVN